MVSWQCEPGTPKGEILVDGDVIRLRVSADHEDADFARWWAMRLVEAATLADMIAEVHDVEPYGDRVESDLPQEDPDFEPEFEARVTSEASDFFYDPEQRRWRRRHTEPTGTVVPDDAMAEFVERINKQP